MGSDDPEMLGAVNALLMEEECFPRVQPPPEVSEYARFFTAYTERCLLEDAEGEWTDSRFAAGLNWVRFFVSLFEDPEVPRGEVHALKTWLERLYRESDAVMRLGLVTAIVEHLFEVRAVAEYFSDWKDDPVLADAHDMAMEYGADWWDRNDGMTRAWGLYP
jgi:hypothetical protein